MRGGLSRGRSAKLLRRPNSSLPAFQLVPPRRNDSTRRPALRAPARLSSRSASETKAIHARASAGATSGFARTPPGASTRRLRGETTPIITLVQHRFHSNKHLKLASLSLRLCADVRKATHFVRLLLNQGRCPTALAQPKVRYSARQASRTSARRRKHLNFQHYQRTQIQRSHVSSHRRHKSQLETSG